jgi:hypothetical protein
MSITIAHDESDSVSACARLALAEASGDVGKATIILLERVRKDKALRHELLEPLVEYACHQAVSRELRSNRANVWSPPSARTLERMSHADRVTALAAGTLLMFPLPGGKRLGEAVRDEISQAAVFYDRLATDTSHKARWLRLVAQSIPSGKTVRDTLTDDRLRELQKEVARA